MGSGAFDLSSDMGSKMRTDGRVVHPLPRRVGAW